MMRRKFFSVARKAAATHRPGMLARQRQTRRVRIRTPDCELSIKFAVARQRCKEGGTFKRLIVEHSSIPSSKLPAASG